MSKRSRGFSLIEVMMALTVLAVASTGALTGLIFASKQRRLGQNTSHGTILAERLLQRVKLANKQKIMLAAQTYSGTGKVEDVAASSSATVTGLGGTGSTSNPFIPTRVAGTALGDLTVPTTENGDFSRGAFFKVDGTGVESRATPTGGATTCNGLLTSGAGVNSGLYCRELAITAATTLSTAVSGGTVGTATLKAEVVVRVFRKGEPGIANQKWTLREVVVQ
jgi:prepilin-type N-terminal cleavage/methylation domain-containing protein